MSKSLQRKELEQLLRNELKLPTIDDKKVAKLLKQLKELDVQEKQLTRINKNSIV